MVALGRALDASRFVTTLLRYGSRRDLSLYPRISQDDYTVGLASCKSGTAVLMQTKIGN